MSVEEQNMPLMHLTHTSEQRSCFRIFWRPEQQLSSKKSLKMQLLLIWMGDLSLSGLMRLRDRRSDWLLDQDKVIGCLLEQNSSSEILHRRKIEKIEHLTASLEWLRRVLSSLKIFVRTLSGKLRKWYQALAAVKIQSTARQCVEWNWWCARCESLLEVSARDCKGPATAFRISRSSVPSLWVPRG